MNKNLGFLLLYVRHLPVFGVEACKWLMCDDETGRGGSNGCRLLFFSRLFIVFLHLLLIFALWSVVYSD